MKNNKARNGKKWYRQRGVIWTNKTYEKVVNLLLRKLSRIGRLASHCYRQYFAKSVDNKIMLFSTKDYLFFNFVQWRHVYILILLRKLVLPVFVLSSIRVALNTLWRKVKQARLFMSLFSIVVQLEPCNRCHSYFGLICCLLSWSLSLMTSRCCWILNK